MSAVSLFKPPTTILQRGPGLNVLKISPDGRLLLAGAMDGTVTIWEIDTGRCIQTWNLSASQGITCAAWCPMLSKWSSDSFAIGSALGQIAVYKKTGASYDYANSAIAFNGSVEDIAFDAIHRRLAAVGDGCLKLYALTDTYLLSQVHSTAPRPNIARTTAFYAQGTCVYVCFLDAKHVTGYIISPWSVQFDVDISTQIGHAALHNDGDLFVTNLRDAMDIYSFPPTSKPKHSVRLPNERMYPLMVAVSSVNGFAVTGGEDGMARVYDPRVGLVVEVLSHGNYRSLVQVVDIHLSRGNGRIVVVTGCADEQDGSIKVWVSRKKFRSGIQLTVGRMLHSISEHFSKASRALWAGRHMPLQLVSALHSQAGQATSILFTFCTVNALTFAILHWVIPYVHGSL